MSVVENAWPEISPSVAGKGGSVGPIAIAVPVAKPAMPVMESAGVCPIAVENSWVPLIGVDVVRGTCE